MQIVDLQLSDATGIEQAALLQIEADAFDAHVAHVQLLREIAHAHALRALEFIHHAQSRAAADLLDEALLQRRLVVEG